LENYIHRNNSFQVITFYDFVEAALYPSQANNV